MRGNTPSFNVFGGGCAAAEKTKLHPQPYKAWDILNLVIFCAMPAAIFQFLHGLFWNIYNKSGVFEPCKL